MTSATSSLHGKSLLTLAVETSTAQGSIALISDNKVIGERTWQRSASHSELLTDSFQNLLRDAGLDAKKINRLAVGIGPGSFTGVRVAVNFARALAFSLKAPVYALDSLRLLAHQPALQSAGEVGHVYAIQYAFRDLVYFASYKVARDVGRDALVIEECSAPEAVTASGLVEKIKEPALVLGDGLEKLADFISPTIKKLCRREKKFRDYALASDFVTTSVVRPEAQLTDWIHTIPLYIRASEAEEKLKNSF